MSFALFALLFALFVAAINYGYLFVDFQLQIGSFIWGKRLGVKRRPVAQLPVTKDELTVLKVLSDSEQTRSGD